MLNNVVLAGLVVAACGASRAGEGGGPRGCPDGTVLVQTEEEASVLAACTRVTGDVAVGPSFALRSLGEQARLARVTGRLEVADNASLEGLFLPGLEAVDGDVIIESNREMATVSLHHLLEVTGDLIVRDNRELVRLDLGALRRVGGRLEVSGHPELDSVVLDQLEHAGDLILDDNPAWPAKEVDAVRQRLGRRASRGDVPRMHRTCVSSAR